MLLKSKLLEILYDNNFCHASYFPTSFNDLDSFSSVQENFGKCVLFSPFAFECESAEHSLFLSLPSAPPPPPSPHTHHLCQQSMNMSPLMFTDITALIFTGTSQHWLSRFLPTLIIPLLQFHTNLESWTMIVVIAHPEQWIPCVILLLWSVLPSLGQRCK